MKRKITILTIAFLSSVLMCANVFAAASGRCGNSIKWTLDDSGNLTLSGSGEMWNYDYRNPPFKDYGIKTVTIGDGITSIGECAFYSCRGLTELALPNSVTSIGEKAFSDCSGLTKITSLAEIPPVCSSNVFDGVNKINCELIVPIVSVVAYKQARGWNEFSNITAATVRCGDSITWTLDDLGNLTLSGSGEMWNYGYDDSPFKDYGIKTVTIGDGITSIGGWVFYGCSGLTKLTLPNSVTSIGESAFSYCRGLTELTLPNSVTSIGNAAFRGCSGLTKLTLPNSITSIEDYAFGDCTGLTKITLPNSVTSIGGGAFWGCSGLEKITVESGNSRYDSRDNCNSIIETKTNTLIAGCKNSIIPNSVTSIGRCAFGGCSGLTELTLPSSVTSIGSAAFQGCIGLTELTLPNSVTSIGDGAFAHCSGLTELTLPNSVTSIGSDAFSGCSGLTELTFPNSVTSIGDFAFYGCSGLTELILPNSVRSIGDCAFTYCSGLSKITSLAEIPPVCGSSVFYGVNKTNCKLIVPIVSVIAYKQAEVWNEFSNIRGFSGVEVTMADGNTIRAIGNQIEISGDFTSVEVYGINGALIYKGKDNVVTVPSAGIYLVHVADKTRKIVVE